jgi:hypothetical protein
MAGVLHEELITVQEICPGWFSGFVEAQVLPWLPVQVAYCQVEPTHPFFWQEVARRVGGCTAADCFSKIFDAAKSPAPSKAAARKITQGQVRV